MLIIDLKSLIYRIGVVAAMLFCMVFILATSVKRVSDKKQLWIEAEDADMVVPPLQVIDMKGASMGKGIIAIGDHLIKAGYAEYEFTVPETAEYILWARCYWLTLCSNSFEVACDDYYPQVLGEDPLMNQWHWVMASKFKLEAGKHKLLLWNREQNSQVDKFLLTTDASYIPAGTGASNSVYEDFEENEIPPSLDLARKDRWEIVNEKDPPNRCLFLKPGAGAQPENDKSLIRAVDPENYVYRVAYKSADPLHANVLVDFNYADGMNYYYADLEGRSIDVYSIKQGSAKLVGHKEYPDPVIRDAFQDLSVERQDGLFRIKYNGDLVFELSHLNVTGGGAGFGSSTGNVYFDNISIKPENAISYMEGFHGIVFQALRTRPEISPQYLEHLKMGQTDWWAIKGTWQTTLNDGFESVKGKADSSGDAIITFGDDCWDRYDLQVAVKSIEEGGVGVLFNFQDSNNYTVFKWQERDSKWTQSLIKVEEGKARVIVEKPALPMKAGAAYWYKLELRTKDDSVRIRLDEEPALVAVDSSLRGSGKVGLWTRNAGGADFDDIKVTTIPDMRQDPVSRWAYDLLLVQTPIAMSYADWVPSDNDVIQLAGSRKYAPLCLNKKLLETAYLYNKNIFLGIPRIEITTDPLPRDVDAEYKLFVYKNGVKRIYCFTAEADQLSLRKDDKIVWAAHLAPTDRSHIVVVKKRREWQVQVDDQAFNYRDDTMADSVRLGFGYSGMGMDKILISSVVIEDPLK